jgi:hypothetical protein
MKIKNILLGILALVAVFLIGMAVGGNGSQSLEVGASGTRFPNGISADKTSPVVGGVRGTTLTITGASTLSGISTQATTSVTSLCVYNGTQFTKISFAAGSTTPAYATSTTCL